MSASSTPTTSEDESSSDDGSNGSLLQEEKTRINKNIMATKMMQRKSLSITEADIARDNHDYFNIVALPVVLVTCAFNYDYPSLSYTGGHFWMMWAFTLIYFVLDLAWVSLVPLCVKSPGVIVKHHIVAMMYLCGPIYYPRFRWVMGSVLSVEINTWFLILRRLVYRSNYCPSGYAKLSPIITTTVSAFFYTTWLAIRCYLFPSILILFLQMWKEEIAIQEKYFFWETLFIPVHAVLCVLNLKWTYDLFKPIIKRWAGIGPKAIVVQNGL